MTSSYDDVPVRDGNEVPLPIIPYVPILQTVGNTATRSDYNAVSTPPSERQAQVAGKGELLPLVYGTDRVGAKITAAVNYNGNLYLRLEWCIGGIDAVSSVLVDDATPAAGVTFTHYTGAQVTPDASLVTAFAANGITYTDTLTGVAYSVGMFPPGTTQGFPRCVAQIRGTKVKTTSGGTYVYNDKPVWLIAYLITEVLKTQIDWTSFATAAADSCDVLVGGEKKRIIGATLDQEQSVNQYIAVLLGYAGCFIWFDNGVYGLTADTASTPVSATITESLMRGGDLQLQTRNTKKSPTVVRVYYTDTTTAKWREDYAEASLSGAGTTLPYTVSEVRKTWINRYSQADREAKETLNDFTLNDLSATFVTRDEGLQYLPGDLLQLTHSLGLSNKKMRVTAISPVEAGRYKIDLREFDPAKYSSDVVTAPTYSDTALQSPSSPPSITNLVVAEASASSNNGYTTTLQITWTGVTWPFLRDYRVMIYDESTLIQDGSTSVAGFTSQPVAIGHNYRVVVYVRSSIAQGTGKQVAYTVNGSTAASPGEMLWASYQITPGASYTATAYQRGIGDVQKHNHVIGCTRGSARYQTLTEITSSAGNVGSWAALDSYAYVILFGDPPGIPGVDYIPGQPVAATVWDSASVSLFGGGHRACRLAVSLDVRQIAASGGNYQIGMTYAPYVGGVLQSSRTTFGTALSVDAASVVVKVATATAGQTNEAVLAAEVTTPGTLYVYTPTTTETKTVTSSASGAVTVTCANNFAKLKGSPVVTPQTTSPRYPVVSNITYGSTCTFDLRVYDENGALTATPCTIAIEGTV